ncbi:metallophosphoesterase [Yersinia enterocolitica]|uniref:metallophosphoesterase n=1 Tax=Yersinia mollaretii TaxID=33060 RepID=UPI0011A84E65|nr:metallophosphoesterase [Yersinia mollaretii]ELZ0584682.1 metallophosphoesterase [Yersinia enterocolitica]HDL7935079.1 metallophosphoesterase [Yersinia enterocolitica]
MPAVFVHVSDIHFGQEKGDDRVHIHDDVKQQLISDARHVVSNLANGVAHGILVTGDIAQSGTKAEYDSAGEWLDELASSIGAEIHCVQMVPGNHDLDRSKLSLSGQAMLDHIRTGGPKEYEQVMNNPVDRAALFARFEDYGNFSFGYNCPLNDEGAFASELEVNIAPGRSIRFIRLNSSLLCHGKERDEDPELMIGARQFVIPRDDGVENVILVHHPLSWYKDQEQVRQYVRSRARVFISGHEHDPKVSVDSVDQGCDVLMLAAGATVPYHSDDIYTFTYNIIEFDWDEEIDGLSVTIHPRAWNPHRTCFENDDKRLGGKDPNYRLNSPNFRVAPRPEVTPSSFPTEPILAVEESTAPFVTEIGTVPVEHPTFKSSSSDTEGYEIARLRFFRDLFEGERLRILVELGALSENFNERMNQGIERKLLDLLVREGKLEGIENMIDQLVSERKDGGNDGQFSTSYAN